MTRLDTAGHDGTGLDRTRQEINGNPKGVMKRPIEWHEMVYRNLRQNYKAALSRLDLARAQHFAERMNDLRESIFEAKALSKREF